MGNKGGKVTPNSQNQAPNADGTEPPGSKDKNKLPNSSKSKDASPKENAKEKKSPEKVEKPKDKPKKAEKAPKQKEKPKKAEKAPKQKEKPKKAEKAPKQKEKPKKPEKTPKPRPQKPKKIKPTNSQLLLAARGKLVALPKPPASLKMLEFLDSVFLQDSCQAIESWNGYDSGSQYVILGKSKQMLFLATEKARCCKVCICRTDRNFKYTLCDRQNNIIMYITRPCSCLCCCGAKFFGDLCGHKIKVTLANGEKAGEIVQACYRDKYGKRGCCCTPMFTVKDAMGNPTLRLAGPSCGSMCCCRASPCCGRSYRVLSLIKNPIIPVNVGKVTDKWGDNGTQIVSEGLFTGSSIFTVGATFPPNLDVRTKATMIGAMFLIDYLHYGKEPCCGICQWCF